MCSCKGTDTCERLAKPVHDKLYTQSNRKPFQPFIFGFAFALFFSFASSFALFFFSSLFSSFFRFKLATSSSVFCLGLKNPSNRACCAVFRFFCSLCAAFRTLSSENPFSDTRNFTSPSTSGAFHLKSHSGCSGGRTSGSRNSRRAS